MREVQSVEIQMFTKKENINKQGWDVCSLPVFQPRLHLVPQLLKAE